MAPSKQLISPKLNMNHLVILGIFLISSTILYRMISSVRHQCISLKNDFEAMKMQASKAAIVVNEFEKFSAVQNDDNISINSDEINTILRKINVDEHSYEAAINEQAGNKNDEKEVQSAFRPLTDVQDDGGAQDSSSDVQDAGGAKDTDVTDKKIIEIGDVDEGDDGEDGAYTEVSLKRKSIGDLKDILKKQNKSVKGNKTDLIKSILE